MKDIAVVTTTITVPQCIPYIYDNAQKYGYDDVHYYIVGDNKTPIKKVNKHLGRVIPDENLTVLSMDDQKEWLSHGKPSYAGVFQENNYQRRILGFLIARQDGNEVIIAVDDDNFPKTEENFIGKHVCALGENDYVKAVKPENSYVNLTDFLGRTDVYTRGYPLSLMGERHYKTSRRTADTAVNIGVWSGDPDIAALSRVSKGDIQIPYNRELETTIVERGCYTSMCLQNVSFNTDYLVTQYEFPMNVRLGDVTLGRYDDIWAGYICKKILDYMDKDMTFGPPTATHLRHPHDAYKDLMNEFWGMIINMYFYPAVQMMRLYGPSYDCIGLFLQLVDTMSLSLRFKRKVIQKYFDRVWGDMRLWAEMVEVIG